MVRLLIALSLTLGCSAAVGDLFRHDGRLLDIQWYFNDATIAISHGVVGPPTIYAASVNRVFNRAVQIFQLGPDQQLQDVGIEAMSTQNPTARGSGNLLTIAISPDDRHLYVGNAAEGGIHFYTRLPNGQLRFENVIATPNHQVNTLMFDSTGRHLYYSYENIQVFSRDPATGRLSARTLAFDLWTREYTISPDGRFVYLLYQGLHVAARDPQTGLLTRLQTVQFESSGSKIHFFESDSASVVYVSTLGDRRGLLHSFAVDRTTGRVTALQSIAAPSNRPFGQIAATATAVYVAHVEQGIAVFARDPATGLLSPPELVNEWPGQVADLRLAQGSSLLIAARGLGLHVYKRETACGVGVPEPCDASAAVKRSKQDPIRCKLIREDLDDRGQVTNSSDCIVDVYEDQQRGFFCRDPRSGVLLGVDRVPTTTARADRLLSFISTDWQARIGFSLSTKDKAQGSSEFHGLEITDTVGLHWALNFDSSVVTLFPMQGGATLCLHNPSLCCVLPPEYTTRGGSCWWTLEAGYASFIRYWARLVPDRACLSGFRAQTTYRLNSQPVREVLLTGCLTGQLNTPHGVGQSISTSGFLGPAVTRNQTVRATIDCTPSS